MKQLIIIQILLGMLYQVAVGQDIKLFPAATSLPNCYDGKIYLNAATEHHPLSWEYYGENGQAGVGTGPIVSNLLSGKYFLTITNSLCESVNFRTTVKQSGYYVSYFHDDINDSLAYRVQVKCNRARERL